MLGLKLIHISTMGLIGPQEPQDDLFYDYHSRDKNIKYNLVDSLCLI